MRREKVEVRNTKDGARDRRLPFRRLGRVESSRGAVVGGGGLKERRVEWPGWEGWHPNGLLWLLEEKGTQSVAGRQAHCAKV